MAKKKGTDRVINGEDLKEYLRTRNDFDLELFVYHTAREHGFKAKHGGTYTDPVTKKPRQFDVRAWHTFSNIYRLDLAIECKSLQPAYPLLLSRIPRTTTENFHQLISKEPSRANAKAERRLGSRSIYHARDFVAKSITQVGRDSDGNFKSGDDVYGKWSQALASADELVSAAFGHQKNRLSTFVVPVLVVSDGMLWVADYSEDGSKVRDPVQADESTLFVGREYITSLGLRYTISHLHIVTKRKVGSFLSGLLKDISPIFLDPEN